VNKTFEANGFSFERDCIWVDKHGTYRRVDFIGKERINCGMKALTLKGAEESNYGGSSWSKEDLESYNAKIVAYAKCGVDKNKDVVRVHDKVEADGDEREVLGSIYSFDGSEEDYFILRDKNGGGGWTIIDKSYCTLVKPKEESIKKGDIITAELKGNVYKLKVVE